jgi:hypothetical protein
MFPCSTHYFSVPQKSISMVLLFNNIDINIYYF